MSLDCVITSNTSNRVQRSTECASTYLTLASVWATASARVHLLQQDAAHEAHHLFMLLWHQLLHRRRKVLIVAVAAPVFGPPLLYALQHCGSVLTHTVCCVSVHSMQGKLRSCSSHVVRAMPQVCRAPCELVYTCPDPPCQRPAASNVPRRSQPRSHLRLCHLLHLSQLQCLQEWHPLAFQLCNCCRLVLLLE